MHQALSKTFAVAFTALIIIAMLPAFYASMQLMFGQNNYEILCYPRFVTDQTVMLVFMTNVVLLWLLCLSLIHEVFGRVFLYDSPKVSETYSDRYRRWTIALALVCLVLLIIITAFTVILFVRVSDGDESKGAKQESLPGAAMPRWPAPSSSPLHTFKHAAVASDDGFCAEIGRNIMIKGGNVVDSIIATCICQGALNSQSSGLGGSFFMTIYNSSTKRCTTIDGRSAAGGAANKNMYSALPRNASQIGWLATAVPGELHGMKTAHKLFGRLPWSQLFVPTIQHLRAGFPASGHLSWALQYKSVIGALNKETGLDIFINPATNEPYKQGEIIKRPVLASTLEAIANNTDPIGLFYNSSMTSTMIEEMDKRGILTRQDFATYSSRVYHEPVIVEFGKNHVICGPPPPSSSGIIAAILKVLAKYKINPNVLKDIQMSELTFHRIIETFKFGFVARVQLGDPAFVPDADEVIKNITSDWWADQVFHLIRNQSLPQHICRERSSVRQDRGTTNMNAVDGDGNAAAITSSVNSYFGCKRRSPKFGVIFNDDMDDFSQPGRSNGFGLPPSAENFIAPGKRPQSSMSPVVMLDKDSGKVTCVLGGAGGSRIISAVSYVAARLIWFNETIKQAIDAPRLHNQFFPNFTYYEHGFPKVYASALQDVFGQNMVQDSPREVSVVTGIATGPNGTLVANSDYRKKGGYPAGY